MQVIVNEYNDKKGIICESERHDLHDFVQKSLKDDTITSTYNADIGIEAQIERTQIMLGKLIDVLGNKGTLVEKELLYILDINFLPSKYKVIHDQE